MTNELIDNLDATGHGGKPIVMGKDPVAKPAIIRGVMAVGLAFVLATHDDGSITFSIPSSDGPDRDAAVTYHRAPLTGAAVTPGMVGVVVHPSTLVTWDWVKPA